MKTTSSNSIDHSKYITSMAAQVQGLKLLYLESRDKLQEEVINYVKSIFQKQNSTVINGLEHTVQKIMESNSSNNEIIYDFENFLSTVIEQVKKLKEINLIYRNHFIQSLLDAEKIIILKQQQLISKQRLDQFPTKKLTFSVLEYNEKQINTFKINMENFRKIKSDYFFQPQMISSKQDMTFTIFLPQVGQDNLEKLVLSQKYDQIDIFKIMRQIGAGIKSQHDQGIIAANICPQNIILQGTQGNYKVKLQIPNILNKQDDIYVYTNNIRTEIKISDWTQGEYYSKDQFFLNTSPDFKSDIISFINLMAFMTYPNQNHLIKLNQGGNHIELRSKEPSMNYTSIQLLDSIIGAYNRQEIQRIDQILDMFQQFEYDVFYLNEDQLKNQEEVQQDLNDYELICKKHKEKIKYQSGNDTLCFPCIMDIYEQQQQKGQSSNQNLSDIIQNIIDQEIFKCVNINQLQQAIQENSSLSVNNHIRDNLNQLRAALDIDFQHMP